MQSLPNSTSDLIWDFIVLWNDRKAFNKILKYEAFTNLCFGESVIAQQSPSINCRFRKEFMTMPAQTVRSQR
jgi:hypothetical protein